MERGLSANSLFGIMPNFGNSSEQRRVGTRAAHVERRGSDVTPPNEPAFAMPPPTRFNAPENFTNFADSH